MTTFVLAVLIIAIVNAVRFQGRTYGDETVALFLQYYLENMRGKLGGFGFLSQSTESAWEAKAYKQNGQKQFEKALTETWKDVLSITLPTDQTKMNYAIISVGSTTTQIAIVINGEVQPMTVEGSGDFGAMSKKTEDEVHQFIENVKQSLEAKYGPDGGDVFIFFINSIGYGITEGHKFVEFNGDIDSSVYSDEGKKKAGLTAFQVITEWKKIFDDSSRFKAVLKQRNVKPKINNEWSAVALTDDAPEKGVKAVCDVGGGFSIKVKTTDDGGEFKADKKTEKTINQLFLEALNTMVQPGKPTYLKGAFRYVIEHSFNTGGNRRIKKYAAQLSKEVLQRIGKAAKNMKGGKKTKLKNIYGYQTGIIRGFYEQLPRMYREWGTAAAKLGDADYYDASHDDYYDEEYVDDYEDDVDDVEYEKGIYKSGYMKGYWAALGDVKKVQKKRNRNNKIQNARLRKRYKY